MVPVIDGERIHGKSKPNPLRTMVACASVRATRCEGTVVVLASRDYIHQFYLKFLDFPKVRA